MKHLTEIRKKVNPTSKVYFDIPLLLDINGNNPMVEENSRNLTHEDIKKIVADLKERGFDERAIVSLRGNNDEWKLASPYFYGVVVSVVTIHPWKEPYKPLRIKWVNGEKDSTHWPQELWLIHPALSKEDLDLKRKEQE